MFLVKFRCNYADEFDMKGFMVVDSHIWNDYVNRLTDADVAKEFYFGTNDAFDFYDKEDYLRNFTWSEVSESELETLKKFFTGYVSSPLIKVKFGYLPINEDAFDPIVDNEEEYDDEDQ